MSDHPYPEHVVEAVAKALYPHVYKWPYDTAHKALQALWDASRINDLDELTSIPGDAVIRGQDYWLGYTPDAQFQLKTEDLPAYVLHWGDRDA